MADGQCGLYRVKSGSQDESWYRGVSAVEELPHTLSCRCCFAWKTRMPASSEDDEVGVSRMDKSTSRTRVT